MPEKKKPEGWDPAKAAWVPVTLTLTEPALGMTAGDPELVREFLASKAPDMEKADEEVEAIEAMDVDEEMRKATTFFPKLENGTPFLWDYQIKGMFKDQAKALRNVKGSHCSGLPAYRQKLDGLLFIRPRRVPLILPAGTALGFMERPLRAQTPKGERIALARSETVPIGTAATFEFQAMMDELEPLVEECLMYGQLRGLCQWRNAGWGRFTYKIG